MVRYAPVRSLSTFRAFGYQVSTHRSQLNMNQKDRSPREIHIQLTQTQLWNMMTANW